MYHRPATPAKKIKVWEGDTHANPFGVSPPSPRPPRPLRMSVYSCVVKIPSPPLQLTSTTRTSPKSPPPHLPSIPTLPFFPPPIPSAPPAPKKQTTAQPQNHVRSKKHARMRACTGFSSVGAAMRTAYGGSEKSSFPPPAVIRTPALRLRSGQPLLVRFASSPPNRACCRVSHHLPVGRMGWDYMVWDCIEWGCMRWNVM